MTRPIRANDKRLWLLPLGTALSLLMSACAANPTIYQPIGDGDIGYDEIRIESNRYRVQFNGGKDASRLDVEKLALKRAADLTLANGGEWFRVVKKDIWKDGDRGAGRRTGVGVGASGGSRGSSVGLGVSIDLTPDQSRYIAMLEIIIGQGDQPTDETDIYDAQSVLKTQNDTP